MAVPASIRNKNPGAQKAGPSSRKFGALKTHIIGGGHSIEQFPTHIHGAAAQFDLLDRLYSGMSVRQAITKWSGGNHVDSYLKVLQKLAYVDPDGLMPDGYFRDPDSAIPFARAMAHHEAGQEYPMSDADWIAAHEMAFPAEEPEVDDGDPAWLNHALNLLGQKEIKGPEHNDKIVRMFNLCGHPEVEDDETAWCAALVGACLVESGYPIPPANGDMSNLLARSYMRYGVPVKEKDVRPGDLRIEERGAAPFGHIGIVAAVQKNVGRVVQVAGNSGDAVAYENKPLAGALGYRRPVKTKPATTVIKESPSLMALVQAKIMLLATFIMSVWQGVVWLYNEAVALVVPLFTTVSSGIDTADMAVSQGKRLSALLAVPWPIWVGTTLTLIMLLYPLVRQVLQRRTGP